MKPLATGYNFVGPHLGSIESAMLDMIRLSKASIQIATYSITDASSLILDEIEKRAAVMVQVIFIVNKLNMQSPKVYERLDRLNRCCGSFQLFDVQAGERADLHAKLIVVDRKRAIIGSSNLTDRGLSRNLEIGLYVEGEGAEMLAETIDRLVILKQVARV